MSVDSLVALLRERGASSLPVGFRFLEKGDLAGPVTAWTWAELDRRARAVAATLLELGYGGERALLLFPPGLDFIAGFFGAMYAGVVAVPVYPPEPAKLPRLQGIVRDARPAVVLTTVEVRRQIESIADRIPDIAVLESIAVDALPEGCEDAWRMPRIGAETLAFLQYTSGSTGLPRGVKITHANALANQRMMAQAFDFPNASGVSWLPLFHDMGLVGTVLQPLYLDRPMTLMSPAAFVKRPIRWLRAISALQASVSGGPDFGYNLAARTVRPADLAELDLSCWKLAFSGAEPVRRETLAAFAAAFAPAGFDPRAFYPTYGLAEATLYVSGGVSGRGAQTLACDAQALEQGRVEPARDLHTPPAATALGTQRHLVDCGPAAPETDIAILRTDGSPAGADEIGQIAVSSPSVSAGYWDSPSATAETFGLRSADGRRWLRTGDLGFLRDGNLFITGRAKDLIIVRGRNHYPQDIEQTVEHAHDAIRGSGAAAFAIPTEQGEGLAVVAEVAPQADLAAVERAIVAAVAAGHELAIAGLALIAPRGLPRTSSGKLQRHATRQAWLDGELPMLHRAGSATPTSTAGLPAWLVEWLVQHAKIAIDRIRKDASFEELGLDSIHIVQLAAAIEERFGTEVPLEVLFGRTLREVADWLDTAGLPASAIERPDLLAVSQLADDIRIVPSTPRGALDTGLSSPSDGASIAIAPAASRDDASRATDSAPHDVRIHPSAPRSDSSCTTDSALHEVTIHPSTPRGDAILLTGATGFLGSHLLAELLSRSASRVICLVRCTSEANGLQRIQEIAQRMQLTIDTGRIDVIPGDLTQPRFGLDEQAFAALAQRIERIVHCGAVVNWSARFADLVPANVHGVHEVVRLSALAGGAAIHHVSTLGVFPIGLSKRESFAESAPLADGELLRVPYFQSKWAAERVLEQARERGIPVAVYRPGLVVLHSRTGAEMGAEQQLLCAFLCGIVRLGVAPAVEKVMDCVPVDFVAAAVAALSLADDTANRGYNLLNPQPLQQSTFYAMLRGRGYRLAPMEFPRWREQILALPNTDAENPLARFALYYRAVTPGWMRRLEAELGERFPVDDAYTRERLDALGIHCPPFDARLVDAFVDHYTQRGLLPRALPRVVAEKSSHQPVLLELPELARPFIAKLPEREQRLMTLYDKAKRKQWDASTRLDWSLEVDPENPQSLGDESIPIFGSPLWKSMGADMHTRLRVHYQGWQLSQFLAGEQGALLCAGRILQQAPTATGRLYSATQVVDEARHVEVFGRILHQKIGVSYPTSAPLQRLLSDVLYDSQWDFTCLGMQVLIEGLGLAVFSMIRNRSTHPLIVSAHAYVVEDEARHVSFGRYLLGDLYHELSEHERAQREEFVIEASYMLRDRFAARDFWEQMDLPVATCIGWIEESGYMRHYRREIFKRIVPVVRAIGLWGPKVRDAYARMGVIDYASLQIDDLIREDESYADRLSAMALAGAA